MHSHSPRNAYRSWSGMNRTCRRIGQCLTKMIPGIRRGPRKPIRKEVASATMDACVAEDRNERVIQAGTAPESLAPPATSGICTETRMAVVRVADIVQKNTGPEVLAAPRMVLCEDDDDEPVGRVGFEKLHVVDVVDCIAKLEDECSRRAPFVSVAGIYQSLKQPTFFLRSVSGRYRAAAPLRR
ncbi:hypothetical protein OBBRIDRAFT_825949 [Obba rivulosa]|uniref:Uncharacterized protein n=1 Tax=Obba rivulosa TaxID=1052685 RepID=A0A8E2DJI4_9APHY|nr:hypothetical protein OBBRIDRAFT_825949 [Obba rivulosa]